MADIGVDPEGMQRASQHADNARLGYERLAAKIASIRERTLACAGDDRYKDDFFDGRDGAPGAGEFLDALEDSAEASAESCGTAGDGIDYANEQLGATDQASATQFN
ncbi:hypothetical protein OIE68_20910 [Nocardia vinacea]|uniref:hypothetical protein n=1 Tax=Nocardia vinacea TaxID=96468 RepID=UPI002E0F6A5C|nr:hypothetical protein OIE68_20910 [Nocardia vinacea]